MSPPGVNIFTGEDWRKITNSPRMNETPEWVAGPKQILSAQLWMCLVMKVKPDAAKNSIA